MRCFFGNVDFPDFFRKNGFPVAEIDILTNQFVNDKGARVAPTLGTVFTKIQALSQNGLVFVKGFDYMKSSSERALITAFLRTDLTDPPFLGDVRFEVFRELKRNYGLFVKHLASMKDSWKVILWFPVSAVEKDQFFPYQPVGFENFEVHTTSFEEVSGFMLDAEGQIVVLPRSLSYNSLRKPLSDYLQYFQKMLTTAAAASSGVTYEPVSGTGSVVPPVGSSAFPDPNKVAGSPAGGAAPAVNPSLSGQRVYVSPNDDSQQVPSLNDSDEDDLPF